MRKTSKAPAQTRSPPSKTPDDRLQELIETMVQLEEYQRHDRDVIGKLNNEKNNFSQRISQLKQDKHHLITQHLKNHDLQIQLMETLREHELKQKQLIREIELKQRDHHNQLMNLRKERDAALAQKKQLQDYAKIKRFMPQKLQILLHPKILLLIIISGLLFSASILLFLF